MEKIREKNTLGFLAVKKCQEELDYLKTRDQNKKPKKVGRKPKPKLQNSPKPNPEHKNRRQKTKAKAKPTKQQKHKSSSSSTDSSSSTSDSSDSDSDSSSSSRGRDDIEHEEGEESLIDAKMRDEQDAEEKGRLHTHGVGFAVNNQFLKYIYNVVPISDRIMYIQFRLYNDICLNIISCYAPPVLSGHRL
jgi:hypothetical protein